ncbi:MAG: membrane protein insertase YidC [Treponema sp.]|nr:membrane protein insertase YidC [Treponema sp.]
MEKRTILAVVLSVVVIIGFYLVQAMYTASKEMETLDQQGTVVTAPVQPAEGSAPQTATVQETAPVVQQQPAAPPPVLVQDTGVNPINDTGKTTTVVVDTNLIHVTLSSAGGDIISYELKEHLDKGQPVDMILAGNAPPHAFSIGFGSREDILAGRVQPVTANFEVRQVSDYSVEFARNFSIGSGDSAGIFTLIKRYDFKPNEYLFQLTVTLDGGHSVGSFDFNGNGYTLIYGPQIGPNFVKLDQRAEYRQYLTFTKNKVKQEKVNTQIKDVPSWAAIIGKYFTLIAIPNMNQFDVFFSDQREEGIPSASRLLISRPSVNSSRIEDQYYFYLGPKKPEILDTYYNGKNNFTPPLSGYQLSGAAKTQAFFSIPPLENLLKFILMALYKVVPNYGVAIILLTILVKLLLFPLTRKSSESTMRMQALSPKIKEIQDKYKDNKQKMNMEMADFYKKEGYNPLSGCLPMLIQLPIFFAMYNLFNNHFDLRGAMFIPGWIPDLALPESVFNFAPYQIPIVGWSDIRLLPFLYVASQLLYGKVTQTPDQKGNSQMKLMLYAMPLIFFFILYDVPSGLLLYWIMSNVLTMAQQMIINKYIAQKKAALKEPEPVIAPTRNSGARTPVLPPKKRKKK